MLEEICSTKVIITPCCGHPCDSRIVYVSNLIDLYYKIENMITCDYKHIRLEFDTDVTTVLIEIERIEANANFFLFMVMNEVWAYRECREYFLEFYGA